MVAKINDVTLLKIAPVTWETKPGVGAGTTNIYIPETSLHAATVNKENTVLTIGQRVISKLRVLRTVSATGTIGESTCIGLVLVDRRYVWQRIEYAAFFNVRRRTGEATISQDTTTPLAVRETTPILRYYPQTLNGLEPYTLRQCVEKVLKDAKQEPFIIPDDFPDAEAFGAKGFAVQDTLARVITGLLKFAPGWSLTCDDDGTIRFYQKVDLKGEKEAEKKMRPKVFAQGFPRVSDLSLERPSKIKVLFLVESEVRFDYDELDDKQSSVSTFSQDIAPLETPVDATLNAVIRAPVPDLTFNDSTPMARDSLVSFYLFLDAINSFTGEAFYPPSPNSFGQPWDYEAITKGYMRPWEVKSRYVNFGGSFPDRNWGRITRTCLRDFRTHYRLNKDWADRVRDVKATRVQLIDSISQNFRKSPVFANYISKPALRMSSVYEKGDLDDLAWVVDDAVKVDPKTSQLAPIKDCKRAPADIVGIDSQSKSFRLLFRRSPRGRDEDVLPCAIAKDLIPKVINATNLRIRLEPGQFIVQDYIMSTVLTCMPQPMTGSTSHLHEVDVSPEDAAKVLGIDAEELGECNGPEWAILVPASPLTTARFFWTDEKRDELIAPYFKKDAKFPETNLQNKEDVDALAKTTAASIYFSMLDRLEGRVTSPATKAPPGIVGGIKSVTTTAAADEDGIITNTINFGAEPVPRNPYNMLPQEIRERLLGLIVPSGGD